MSLSIRVEELARAVVCLDSTDLPSLVRVQDDLTDLAASMEEPGQQTLASVCRRAAEAIEQIVLRTVDDTEGLLAQVRRAVEYAQQVVDTAITGLDPASVPPPPDMAGAVTTDAAATVDPELLSAWISSCSSALADLEAAVIAIDAGQEDSGQQDDARRIIHTIKGEAGILSLGALQRVCHECESLIDLARERTRTFPVEEVLAIIDWVRASITCLSDGPTSPLPAPDALLDRIARAAGALGAQPPAESPADSSIATGAQPAPADAPPPGAGPPAPAGPHPAPQGAAGDGPVAFPPEAVIDETSAEFVCEAREHIANAEQSLLDLESDLGNLELINTVFRAFHTIKGVAGFMHLTPIVRLTHVAETLLDRARSGTLGLTPSHLDLFLKACDILGQLIGAIQGGTPPTRRAFDRLTAHLDHACATGEAPAQPATAEAGAADAPRPASMARTLPPDPASPECLSPGDEASDPAVEPAAPAGAPRKSTPSAGSPQKNAARLEQTVKVNTTRMDALVDMVGELVIGYQMIYQDEAIQGLRQQRTQRTLGHVSKIIRDLQEVAMSLRLVTLRPTFQKMARLVRDVSAKAGKSISFHTEGEDVELDRNVVEEIADPLVHMIRNACDHGIEGADARRAAGKPPEGNLWLRAYHQGGTIVVEIADDGRGLDREKILKKAIAKGIYTTDRDLSEISDAEAHNLVFLPGFSTADKVTDISGRGVGMDVVRRNIEALRGKIEISSEPGRGSKFRMRLPLTMAIIDGMIVRVGSQRYVIPTLSIEQSFRPQARDIHTVVGRGEMVKVRGSLLPVYRAKRVFGLADGVDDVQNGLLVVLEAHDARFCLLVDEIVGQQQVVIKNLGHGLTPIRGVSGGAILGDGRVALILDVGGIIQEATRAAAAAA